MPDHPVALLLCRDVGPLAVATAGAQGEPDFETAEEVAEEFDENEVPVVLDGGPCTGLPSTVVDGTGEDLHVIREGRLPWTTILEALGR
jgi:L-threonylcarbamoyladenylate synthase